MSNPKKSHKEVLIERLTKEGKVKTISPKEYSRAVNKLGKNMADVVNEFKVLDLQSNISASQVRLNS